MEKKAGEIRIRRAHKNSLKGFSLEIKTFGADNWERFAFCYVRLHVGPELARVDIEIIEKIEEAINLGYEFVVCPGSEHEWHGREGYNKL